jgi:glutathione S-transferase
MSLTVREELPTVLDYLEQQVPREGFLYGGAGIADISVAAFFRNLGFARQRAVLRAAGAQFTAQTLGGDTPRPGSMHS